jgi:alpha-1,3-rhamnosyl/mannosyltransferase
VSQVRIAMDARKLFDGGVGTYIREVLGACAAAPRGYTFSALVDPADLGRVRWAGAVSEHPVTAGKYGLLEHVVVPAAARRAGATLLHEPHYTLPLGWTGRAVSTIHDLTHLRFAHFYPPGAALYARAMAGLAVARSQRVIVDSEDTRADVLERLHAPEHKVRVVPLGVSPALAPPAPVRVAAYRAARELPRDYLLYVGARKRHKNLALLFDALAVLPPGDRPPLVLSGRPFAPGDPLGARLVARGLGGLVHFAGDPAADDELACLYGGAILYVQPSLAEGFGLPPLEAMACGTPVLSSNAGALPEVVGDAGTLLAPRDPAAWADAIRRLTRDAAERARLAECGRRRAATFTWERTGRMTLDVYAEALA